MSGYFALVGSWLGVAMLLYVAAMFSGWVMDRDDDPGWVVGALVVTYFGMWLAAVAAVWGAVQVTKRVRDS